MGFGWQEILVLLLVGGVLYLVFFSTPARRRMSGWTEETDTTTLPAPKPEPESAEAILEARYARGEIDTAEFEARRAVLRKGKA